jgi:uncharacterized protein (DUF1800 family)
VLEKFLRLISIAGAALMSVSLAHADVYNPDVVRFLEQSSWGPTTKSVQNCQNLGSIANCLKAEFQAAPNLYPVPLSTNPGVSATCPHGSPANCFRDNFTQYSNQITFFTHALTGNDQLRQRVAFALHQILVVSGVKVMGPSFMAPYLNILLTDAFSNYRTILQDITLNPAMAYYLDMANNDKPSADGLINSNENYAREVMQLFTVGLNWLNPDGTLMLDKQNQPIPTYDQTTVEGFAHVFTGWTYANLSGSGTADSFPNTLNFAQPLVLYRDQTGVDVHHDKSPKTLLSLTPNGVPVMLSANNDGQNDLQDALDNLFNHPNVGTFIGKQLIQHLVTDNPSIYYVNRVTTAFNTGKSFGFGSGNRGDMQAVIAAVLLDQEARGAAKADAGYGRLREPAQFVLNILRILNANSDGILNQMTKSMGQDIFNSPSVFNYFPHSFTLPGSTLQEPEFAIDASSAAIARINFINSLLFSQASDLPGTTAELSPLIALAANPNSLINILDQFCLHGFMTNNLYTQLVNTLNAIPSNQLALRAQTALYLFFASGQYQVQR